MKNGKVLQHPQVGVHNRDLSGLSQSYDERAIKATKDPKINLQNKKIHRNKQLTGSSVLKSGGGKDTVFLSTRGEGLQHLRA